MINNKTIAEEIAHDTKKTLENFRSVNQDQNKSSPKDYMALTTLGSKTSDTENNIKRVLIIGDSMVKHVNGCEISRSYHRILRCV